MRLAQLVHARRHVDRIAFAPQRLQRFEEALEDGEERRRAGVARVRREVEQHQRHLALGAFAATQRDELRDASRERFGAIRAGEHVLRAVLRAEGAAAVTAVAGRAVGARAAAEHDRAGRAVEFGDRHHDRCSRPAAGRAPTSPTGRRSGIRPGARRGKARRGSPALLRRRARRCRPGRRRARSPTATRPRRRPRGRSARRTSRSPGANRGPTRKPGSRAGPSPRSAAITPS